MRKRNPENVGLPSRWRFTRNAYYYQVPPGKEANWDNKKTFKLGKTYAEAAAVWAERLSWTESCNLMSQLFDRYSVEVVPHKAAATRRSNGISIKRLKGVFSDSPAKLVEPQHIYQYRDACTKKNGPVSANRDLEVLSHVFTKAIEWGVIGTHPMTDKKVVKNKSQKRDRYVEDWELKEALKVCSPFLTAYINLKMLLGVRKGDMLSIKLSDIKDDGLHIKPRKTASTTGKKKVYPLTPELESAIAEIKSLHKKVKSVWLFHTRKGQPYIKEDGQASGFDSVWRRMMNKALKETKLSERFTEHDLRAKVASDTDAQHARDLLDHSTDTMTDKYRRKARVVEPAKWKAK